MRNGVKLFAGEKKKAFKTVEKWVGASQANKSASCVGQTEYYTTWGGESYRDLGGRTAGVVCDGWYTGIFEGKELERGGQIQSKGGLGIDRIYKSAVRRRGEKKNRGNFKVKK